MNQKNQKEGGGEGGWGRSPDGVVRIVYFGETEKEHKRKCDAKDFGFCIDFGADCPNMPNETKKEECEFTPDGEYHSCHNGCDGIVENCRKCHRDRCSNEKCPNGKGFVSSPHIPTGEEFDKKCGRCLGIINTNHTCNGTGKLTGEDWINTVNNFIKKWCGENVSHLLDSDDNDGEKLRQLLLSKEKQWKDEMAGKIRNLKHPSFCDDSWKNSVLSLLSNNQLK